MSSSKITSIFPFFECVEQRSLLLLGDKKGGVHILRFLKPTKGLFKSASKKGNLPQRNLLPSVPRLCSLITLFTKDTMNQWLFCLRSGQDLGQHSHMASYRQIPNIHQEPINRLMNEPKANVVMTSSDSPVLSVVNVTLKWEPNIWCVKQVISLCCNDV